MQNIGLGCQPDATYFNIPKTAPKKQSECGLCLTWPYRHFNNSLNVGMNLNRA